MKLKQQTRLSILVIVLAAVLLEANTALEFFSTRRSFNEQLTEKAQRDLNESHRIGKVKQEVETAVRAALPTIERLAVEVDADSLRQAMRQLVLGQEQIVGVSVGFQPGYVHGGVGVKHTDGALFGLYVYEVGEGKDMRLKEPTYDIDYTQRPWYERALGSDGYWSEPYEGKYSYVLMCSYSLPVHDAHGQTVAVLSADVPLRELSQMAAQFYENQQRAVLRNTLLHLLGLLLLGFIVYRAVAYLRRLQTVSAEKERIAGELRVAHDIQQSMIPKTFPGFPERDDLELYAQLTPAREVGGDFYDFLIRDERLYFCVGDVTGKGVPAALLMTVMRALFRTEAGRPIVQFGNIYRLVSPYDRKGLASMMYVTDEQDKAVFYWWKTESFQDEHLPRVKMAGLIYKVLVSRQDSICCSRGWCNGHSQSSMFRGLSCKVVSYGSSHFCPCTLR